MSGTHDARAWIGVVRGSHDRLGSLIDALTPDLLTGPSYCRDWTVAQVLSHLGSGAEIFSLFVNAAASGEAAPGRDTFQPIWDSWNDRPPERQAADCRAADGASVARFESLTDDELSTLHLAAFGMELDATGLARMRLSEHAVHTWDVAVALDPNATISPDAVAFLLDHLGQLAGRTGRPADEPWSARLQTTDPIREFLLVVDESVQLLAAMGEAGYAGGEAAEAAVELRAEALVRLVYGRLDPGHTPAGISTSGVDLDRLRQVFPGF